MAFAENLKELQKVTKDFEYELVAVSKTRTADEVRQAYQSGQRLFAENYAQ